MSSTEELFLAAGIWTIVAMGVSYLFRSWPSRIAFVAVVVAVPFWELPYGYYNFQQLCSEESMPRVFGRIPSQSTICVEEPDPGFVLTLLRMGFKTIRVPIHSRNFLAQHSEIPEASVLAVDSKEGYCVRFATNIQLSGFVLRHDTLLVRSKDEFIAARQSRFHWTGLWWQREMAPVLGSGGYCNRGSEEIFKLLLRGASDTRG